MEKFDLLQVQFALAYYLSQLELDKESFIVDNLGMGIVVVQLDLHFAHLTYLVYWVIYS